MALTIMTKTHKQKGFWAIEVIVVDVTVEYKVQPNDLKSKIARKNRNKQIDDE